jgi:hypothetical protein
MRRLLVTASVVPSLPIIVTLRMEALRSTETPVLTRATRRNIPEEIILHSHRRENLKFYFETLISHIRNVCRVSLTYGTQREEGISPLSVSLIFPGVTL